MTKMKRQLKNNNRSVSWLTAPDEVQTTLNLHVLCPFSEGEPKVLTPGLGQHQKSELHNIASFLYKFCPLQCLRSSQAAVSWTNS